MPGSIDFSPVPRANGAARPAQNDPLTPPGVYMTDAAFRALQKDDAPKDCALARVAWGCWQGCEEMSAGRCTR